MRPYWTRPLNSVSSAPGPLCDCQFCNTQSQVERDNTYPSVSSRPASHRSLLLASEHLSVTSLDRSDWLIGRSRRARHELSNRALESVYPRSNRSHYILTTPHPPSVMLHLNSGSRATAQGETARSHRKVTSLLISSNLVSRSLSSVSTYHGRVYNPISIVR